MVTLAYLLMLNLNVISVYFCTPFTLFSCYEVISRIRRHYYAYYYDFVEEGPEVCGKYYLGILDGLVAHCCTICSGDCEGRRLQEAACRNDKRDASRSENGFYRGDG